MQANDARMTPDGTRYWCYGKGDPIVLIHGVGLDACMWELQIQALSETYQVIVYDMLGHGKSRQPEHDEGLTSYANQLLRLVDYLGLSEVSVLGFSMGGLVARAFVLKYPEKVASLIILSSVFARDSLQREQVLSRVDQARKCGPSANLDKAIERWFSKEFSQKNPSFIARIREIVSSNDPQGYLHSYAIFGQEDSFGIESLSRINVPVLVATGELDQGSTPEMAKALSTRIPNAECAVMVGQRHMLPVESSEMVNEMILKFMAKNTTINGVAESKS